MTSVGIRHLLEHERLAAVLAVEDLAVVTSASTSAARTCSIPTPAGRRAGCCRSPWSGRTSRPPDAYATAALAMGAAGPAWTAALAGCDAMCVTADGRVLSTPGFSATAAGRQIGNTGVEALVRSPML